MSLGIAFKGAEGIVLAADSRVTLRAEVQLQTECEAAIDPHLEAELQAWDLLSDEALNEFEQGLE